MSRIAGCIHFVQKNEKGELEDKTVMVAPCYYEDLNIILKKDRTYLVSIDQSSSCTGIYIKESTGLIDMVLDVKRDGMEKEIFYRELEGLLKKLLKDIRVSLLVHEEPVPNRAQYYSGKVLLELKGRLRDWIAKIPSLQEASIVSIYPQSWKSLVLDKQAAKDAGETMTKRGKSKAKIALDVCRYAPWFDEYRKFKFSTDYDAFDAVGILTGYIFAAFNEDGTRKIYGIQEKKHTSFVFYKYVPITLFEDGQNYMRILLQHMYPSVYPTMLFFNERYKFVENIRMASSNNKVCLTFLPKSEVQRLQWQYNFDKKENHIMVALICNKSKFTKKELESLARLFPWNEEIKGS